MTAAAFPLATQLCYRRTHERAWEPCSLEEALSDENALIANDRDDLEMQILSLFPQHHPALERLISFERGIVRAHLPALNSFSSLDELVALVVELGSVPVAPRFSSNLHRLGLDSERLRAAGIDYDYMSGTLKHDPKKASPARYRLARKKKLETCTALARALRNELLSRIEGWPVQATKHWRYQNLNGIVKTIDPLVVLHNVATDQKNGHRKLPAFNAFLDQWDDIKSLLPKKQPQTAALIAWFEQERSRR